MQHEILCLQHTEGQHIKIHTETHTHMHTHTHIHPNSIFTLSHLSLLFYLLHITPSLYSLVFTLNTYFPKPWLSHFININPSHLQYNTVLSWSFHTSPRLTPSLLLFIFALSLPISFLLTPTFLLPTHIPPSLTPCQTNPTTVPQEARKFYNCSGQAWTLTTTALYCTY